MPATIAPTRDRTPMAALGRFLARLGWGAVFAGHLAPTLTALTSVEADWMRASVLLACQLLFLLKLVDAPFLRLPSSPRARWALTLVVVLMHGRVLANYAGVDLKDLSAVAVEAVTIVTAGVLLLPRRRESHRNAAGRSPIMARADRAIGAIPPRFELLLRSLSLQRPPPRCA